MISIYHFVCTYADATEVAKVYKVNDFKNKKPFIIDIVRYAIMHRNCTQTFLILLYLKYGMADVQCRKVI